MEDNFKIHEEEYQLQVLQNSQVHQVLDALNNHYVTREAVCVGLKSTIEEMYEFNYICVKNSIECGVSVAIIDSASGEIAGVMLNNIQSRNTGLGTKVDKDFKDKPMKYSKLNVKLDGESKMFENSNVDKYLELSILLVKEKYSGKGFSIKMIQRSEIEGRKKGCQVAFAHASGQKSQHVFGKANFEPLYILPYKSFEIDGESIFDPNNEGCIIAMRKDLINSD